MDKKPTIDSSSHRVLELGGRGGSLKNSQTGGRKVPVRPSLQEVVLTPAVCSDTRKQVCPAQPLQP